MARDPARDRTGHGVPQALRAPPPRPHPHTGRVDLGLPTPLRPDQLEALVSHATTPLCRAILAFTAIHAARPTALRELLVDDAGLADRRITIGGHPRRLDDAAAQVITQYLRYRHRRWPYTNNPHPITNEHTAQNEKPASPHRLSDQFRETGVTLNQIRMHRQLEEALTHGPYALHLAAVFGISQRAAIRYANAARAFLGTRSSGSSSSLSPSRGSGVHDRVRAEADHRLTAPWIRAVEHELKRAA